MTSRLTIPMTASMDRGIVTVPVITAQVAQLQVNGEFLSYQAKSSRRHAIDRSRLRSTDESQWRKVEQDSGLLTRRQMS